MGLAAQQKNSEQQKLRVKAAVNKWMSDYLNSERSKLSLGNPDLTATMPVKWIVALLVKNGRQTHRVGEVHLDDQLNVVHAPKPGTIAINIQSSIFQSKPQIELKKQQNPYDLGLFHGDGIGGSARLDDESVDLLLTDPPYSISNAYTCEKQIPRRLRTNGADFIMPKGDFGDWDRDFNPKAWTDVIIPKVRGWAVIFCAQAQIGEYDEILKKHGFNAVGTIVWHKTNPVPFNTRFKPVNAWEAGVIGKRPGAKFYGKGAVHNVFTYKSPSPQHRIHPTQKPLDLFRELTRLFSRRGDLVLDPFAGSATTVCAAFELKRKAIAFENNDEYYAAASRRVSAIQLAI